MYSLYLGLYYKSMFARASKLSVQCTVYTLDCTVEVCLPEYTKCTVYSLYLHCTVEVCLPE